MELGGAAGTLAHVDDAVGQSEGVGMQSPLAKRTPDKRRNHLRCHHITKTGVILWH